MKHQNKRKRLARRKTETIFLVNRQAEVISVSVDDPYFNRAHDETASNTRQTQALLNVRESPARYYEARDKITKDMAAAADRFRRLYEMAGGGSVKAMDTTKEPVDGGFMSDGLTDAKLRAANELKLVYLKLGKPGYELVEQVCGHLIWVKHLSRTDYETRRNMERLRDSLDTLSLFWGFRTRWQAHA